MATCRLPHAWETINVRGGQPVSLTVRATRHGPVVTDMLPASTIDPGYVLALQTTFLDDEDGSAEALWDIDRATDWDDFQEDVQATSRGPPQNVVYADIGGTIGFIAPGRIPIRKNSDGWLPVPGWSGDYDWQGFIPFDQLPQGNEPGIGTISSAPTTRSCPTTTPYFISRDWDLPDRAERIEQLLDATPRQTPETSAAHPSPIPCRRRGETAGAANDPRSCRRATTWRARRSSAHPGGISTWTRTGSNRCCSPRGCAPLPARSCPPGSAGCG